MRKKWLAAVLCLCLVVGLLPGTALAADRKVTQYGKLKVWETDIRADDVVDNNEGYGSLKIEGKGSGLPQIALVDRNGKLLFPYREDDPENIPFGGARFFYSDGIVSMMLDSGLTNDNGCYLTETGETIGNAPVPRYYHLDGSEAFSLDVQKNGKTHRFNWGERMRDGYTTVVMSQYPNDTYYGTYWGTIHIIDKNGKITYTLPEEYNIQYPNDVTFWKKRLGQCGEGLFGVYEYDYDIQHYRMNGFMDPYGNMKIDLTGRDYIWSTSFWDGAAMVEDENNKCGFIDKKGVEFIPCEYTAVRWNKDLFAVEKDEKWGFVNKENETVIPFEYDDAQAASDGYAPAARDGKFGIVSYSNEVIVPFEFDGMSHYEGGVAYAVKDGRLYIISEDVPTVPDETAGIYTVSFDTTVHSITVPSQKTNAEGKLTSLPSPTRDGYSLDGWFTAKEDGKKISTDYVFDRDTTVYAHWTESRKPDSDPGGSSSNGGGGGGSSKPSIRPGANTNKPTTPTTPTTPNTPSGSASSFSDVRSSDWHAAAVNYVVSRGIMNGTGNGAFSPNATTTRGMVMTMLARLSGVSTDGGSVWYERGMQWAKQQGISDGSNPNGAVSREQLVSMLYRSMNSPAVSGSLTGFPDASKVSSWAADAMAWAVANGLIQGDNKGALNPGGSATRAEVATILMRYCEKFGK